MSSADKTERCCVYTVLTGGYERLLEQPMARESDLDFIAFTDDEPVSQTWDVRRFEPMIEGDPRRSHNVVRLRPHEYLADYAVSIYIDNTIVFTRPPEELLEIVPRDAGVAACPGPRPTTEDAFRKVAERGLAPQKILQQQFDDYRRYHPELLRRPFFSAGIMVRRHHRPDVVAAMEIWLQHVLRYSARNHMSQQIALGLAGLDWHPLPFHVWDNPYAKPPDRSSRIPGRERADKYPSFELSG